MVVAVVVATQPSREVRRASRLRVPRVDFLVDASVGAAVKAPTPRARVTVQVNRPVQDLPRPPLSGSRELGAKAVRVKPMVRWMKPG